MRDHRAVYRGYAIYVSGVGCLWSFHAEPISVGLPILPRASFEGHATCGLALSTAKRRIDNLLSE